jgi:hypothetical protein
MNMFLLDVKEAVNIGIHPQGKGGKDSVEG